MKVAWIDSLFGLIDSKSNQVRLTLRQRLAIWVQRAASRRELAELEDHMLKDIGITRQQAVREARRPFYDGGVAPHWKSIQQTGYF